ncbi:hypothetical protein GN958_ATG03067 [Phytophthora infestans]|uniref:Uncharacterized protein n=1 Tax=Phytophthora infestans TaxID=4787 RepID=A0A8S9V8K0_PHYIN|nr:hypothetical protein GN958_ATG03067 [Phytophthora infestans]
MRKMMRSRTKHRVERVLLRDARECIKPGTLTESRTTSPTKTQLSIQATIDIPYVIVSSFSVTALSFTLIGFLDASDVNWGVATIALYWVVIAPFLLQQVHRPVPGLRIAWGRDGFTGRNSSL